MEGNSYILPLPEYEEQDLLMLLSEEEISFAQSYMSGMEAFKAVEASAKRAMAQDLALERASQHFANPYVQRYMKVILVQRASRVAVSGQKVIEELAKIAFSNIRDILEIEEDSNLVRIKHLHEIPYPEVIKEFKTKRVGASKELIYEVKLYDKMQALDTLSKLLGLYDPEAGLKHRAPKEEEKEQTNITRVIINHRRPGDKLQIES